MFWATKEQLIILWSTMSQSLQLLFRYWISRNAHSTWKIALYCQKNNEYISLFCTNYGWKLRINPTSSRIIPQKRDLNAYSIQNNVQKQCYRVIRLWWTMHWFMLVKELRHILWDSFVPGKKIELLWLSSGNLYRQKLW